MALTFVLLITYNNRALFPPVTGDDTAHHPDFVMSTKYASTRPKHKRLRRRRVTSLASCAVGAFLALSIPLAAAEHHFKQPPLHLALRQDANRPIRVTNHCPENLWPAFLTQHGVGPPKTGFLLGPGQTNSQEVSGDWQGRVWARTNCSFGNAGAPASGNGGAPCRTGDCGNFLECQGAVRIWLTW